LRLGGQSHRQHGYRDCSGYLLRKVGGFAPEPPLGAAPPDPHPLLVRVSDNGQFTRDRRCTSVLDSRLKAAPMTVLQPIDPTSYAASPLRHDWTVAEVEALLALPFPELMFRAQTIHRAHFDPTRIQVSTLLSIKTGGCPEDCGYCSQSAHHDTGLAASKLMPLAEVLTAARAARDAGATRFCMGAAWRSPKARDLDAVCTMIAEVKALGLQTCATLGMVDAPQAERLAQAGLDYYNHNLDTSEAHYAAVIGTRTYQDRLDTLAHVREAGMNVCCGGIVGLGESDTDQADLIATLANLPEHPQSVPVNRLVPVAGTPLANAPPVDTLRFVRLIAAARITMPRAYVRLSAGRESLSDETQALCFLAGANSIFYGSRLLTTPNATEDADRTLFARLGLQPEA
jgi:biotin synthase